MSRNFVIKTTYKADGSDVTKTHTRMSKSFGRFASQMADSNSMIGKSFGRMNQSINRGLVVALTSLVAMIGLATNEYIKFDQAVTGANARFVDFDIGEPMKNLQALKDAARAVGAETQFSATEAAAGLNFYAKAGFTTTEAMQVLADTVDLATVAEADFNRTADISSDLLGALGKNVDNSAKKIENLKEINRALGITANSANVDLEDLFETLKVAAPIATAAGEGMNELFAITGALGSAGIKGSMGATALKNAYIRLAAPTEAVTKALDKLNLQQSDFIDSDGKMKSMVTIMDMLGKASTGLGDAEQLGIFAEIFGKNAVAGATNLAGSLSEVETIMKKLESATALKDLADEIRKGLGMQIEILKSGLIELGFKFVEAFEKDGRGALQNLINFVQKVDITPIVKLTTVIGKVFKLVANNWKILLSFAGGIKAVAAAMVVLNIATTIFNATLKASTVGIIITAVFALGTALVLLALNWDKVTAALKVAWNWVANVGQKFLFILGPIGFLVSGIIEIVKNLSQISTAFKTEGIMAGLTAIAEAFNMGLIIPVQKAWELLKIFGAFMAATFTPILQSIGNWLKWLGNIIMDSVVFAFKTVISWIAETGQKFTFILGPVGLLASAFIEVAKQWENVTNSFQTGGILSGIKSIGSTILSSLLAPMQGFLEMISNIPGIGNLAEGGAKKIEEIRESLNVTVDIDTKNIDNITPIDMFKKTNNDFEFKSDTNRKDPEFPSFPSVFNPDNNKQNFGQPETPTPITPLGVNSNGTLDINIKNSAGENAEIKQNGNMPTGTNLNFKPAVSM